MGFLMNCEGWEILVLGIMRWMLLLGGAGVDIWVLWNRRHVLGNLQLRNSYIDCTMWLSELRIRDTTERL